MLLIHNFICLIDLIYLIISGRGGEIAPGTSFVIEFIQLYKTLSNTLQVFRRGGGVHSLYCGLHPLVLLTLPSILKHLRRFLALTLSNTCKMRWVCQYHCEMQVPNLQYGFSNAFPWTVTLYLIFEKWFPRPLNPLIPSKTCRTFLASWNPLDLPKTFLIHCHPLISPRTPWNSFGPFGKP